jgi:hypothetical protein
MLMGAHNGAVDHGVFIVCVGREMLENPLPHTGLCPTAEPAMHILPITEALRQVTPGCSDSVAIEYRLDEQPVVSRGYSDGPLAPW